SKIYGSEAVLSGYAASGLVNGDSISAVSLSSSGATRTAGVGSYGISASGALGTGLTNYAISYGAGTLSVTPAALT
ncbi:MBG domain-containing protein, partial [Enterococcus faecium]